MNLHRKHGDKEMVTITLVQPPKDSDGVRGKAQAEFFNLWARLHVEMLVSDLSVDGVHDCTLLHSFAPARCAPIGGRTHVFTANTALDHAANDDGPRVISRPFFACSS